MPPQPCDLTLIMPSLNEEKNIEQAIRRAFNAFDEYEVSGEIIVVNDGSSDSTQDLVEELMKGNPKLSLINHGHALGIGASFWDGIDQAAGIIVSWLPGDNEGDPFEICRYVKLLQHVDIVIPFVYNKEVRSVHRNFLSSIFCFIINSTFRVNFNYTNGTVIFRKSILLGLDYRSKSFFFLTDILVRLVKQGYLFAEVPIRLGTRKAGVSKAVSFPSLVQVFNGYILLLKDCFYLRKYKKIKKEFDDETITAKRR
jgi:dolichol-phosphate mannosyltransferase